MGHLWKVEILLKGSCGNHIAISLTKKYDGVSIQFLTYYNIIQKMSERQTKAGNLEVF